MAVLCRVGLRVGNVTTELGFREEMGQKDPKMMEYLKAQIKVSTIIKRETQSEYRMPNSHGVTEVPTRTWSP